MPDGKPWRQTANMKSYAFYTIIGCPKNRSGWDRAETPGDGAAIVDNYYRP